MAEKIVIAELEIDTKALQKTNADLIKSISILREEQKSLKKETNNLTEATDEQTEAYSENDAELKSLSTTYNKNKKVLAENTTGVKNLNKELTKENKSILDARDNNKKLISVRNQLNASNEDHKSAIDEINKKLDENNAFMTENKSGIEQMKDGIGGYEEAITNALGKIEIFGVNLGDLSNKTFQFRNKLVFLKEQLRATNTSQDALNKSTKTQILLQKVLGKGLSKSAKSLKIFKLALISTGVGALIVLLGSLVSFLSTTQEGMNSVKRATTPLKIVFKSVGGEFQKFGKSLVERVAEMTKKITEFGESTKKAFSDPKTAILKFSDTLKTKVSDTVDKLKDKFNNLGESSIDLQGAWDNINDRITNAGKRMEENAKITKAFLKEAYERGEQIADIQIKLSSSQADFITNVSDLKVEYKALNKLAEDQTQTLLDREEAAEKSIGTLAEINKLQKERTALEVNLLELQFKSNDTSDEDRVILAKKLAEQNEADAQRLEAETTQQNKLNGIRKEANAKAVNLRKKRQELEFKTLNEELALFIAIQRNKDQSAEERILFEQDLSDQRIAILDKEYEYGRISKQKYEEQKLTILYESSRKQAEISIANLEFELQNNQASLDDKLLKENLTNEQILTARVSSLDVINNIELEKLQEQYDAKLLSQEQFDLLKLQQENEYQQSIKDLSDEYRLLKEEEDLASREKEKERDTLDFENRFAALEGNLFGQLELRRENLELQKAIELENAETLGADLSAIKKKYAEIEKAIELQKETFKLDAASKTFASIASIAGEQTAIGKAAAIAETSINTYKAAQQAYTAMAGIPVFGPTLGVVAATAAVAGGLANVKKIIGIETPKPKTKAEKGALFNIGGNRHTQGGTKFYGEDGTSFEAERGEILGVMNRNAASLFMEFNDKYRSGGTSKRQNVFASGGAVQRQRQITDNVIDYDLLAEKIAEANMSLPAPIVGVTDIIDESVAYNNVVELADL